MIFLEYTQMILGFLANARSKEHASAELTAAMSQVSIV
jgi:hypothetical protein